MKTHLAPECPSVSVSLIVPIGALIRNQQVHAGLFIIHFHDMQCVFARFLTAHSIEHSTMNLQGEAL